jgi:hypothetical protein
VVGRLIVEAEILGAAVLAASAGWWLQGDWESAVAYFVSVEALFHLWVLANWWRKSRLTRNESNR